MKKLKQLTNITYITFLFIGLIAYGQDNVESLNKIQQVKIDAYIKHIQKRHEVPGVSLAILKKGKVIYQNNYGKANIEHNVEMHDASIFRVYSLTKPIVSVAVFQLIEQGKLSLEDRIDKYVKGLPNDWYNTQIKHLLTHSSGLPNMGSFPSRSKLTESQVKDTIFKLKKVTDLGETYQYNQTNFWLLQLIIEKVTGELMEDFILKNQFDNERQRVFFSSNSKRIVMNRVTAYFPFETGTIQIDHPSLIGRYMFAANGLNITMSEFVKWDQKLRNNELIRKETKEQMWKTFPYSKSNKRFAYSWDKRIINGHDSFGFSGSLITAYRIFPEDELSIVFLSNGLGNYYNIENIINHIASLIDEDIQDFQNTAFETLSQAIIDGNVKTLDQQFQRLKSKKESTKMNLEIALNDLGYQLVNQRRMDKAVKVFTFNTQKHPTSANTFDSLGEVYLMMNDFDSAEKNYQRAIALGGTNGNAKNMLEQIKQTKKN